MNRLLILGFFALIFCIVFPHDVDANRELRTKVNRALRNFPTVEEIKQQKYKSLGNPVPNMRSPHKKRDSANDSLPQLAKNIQSFLQKVIPNHGLVQDLMGYITMPNPNARKSRQYSP